MEHDGARFVDLGGRRGGKVSWTPRREPAPEPLSPPLIDPRHEIRAKVEDARQIAREQVHSLTEQTRERVQDSVQEVDPIVAAKWRRVIRGHDIRTHGRIKERKAAYGDK